MPDSASITMFICANCARPAKNMTSARRSRPVVPDFEWPCKAQQVIVPCAGRLQPEHVLKVFEAGTDVVSVVACKEDNCHYIEGSRRCTLRVDFIRSILNEIGLGEERLLLSYLPGSAMEDLARVSGDAVSANGSGSLMPQVADIREHVLQTLRDLAPNPLRNLSQETESDGSSEEEIVYSGVGSE